MSLLTADKKHLIFYAQYDQREAVKGISGYQWDARKKAWLFPLNKITLQKIISTFPSTTVKDVTHKMLNDFAFDLQMANNNKKKHFIINEQYRNWLNAPFYDHQLQTYNFFKHMNICADTSEPGTGKTMIQLGLIKDRIMVGNSFRYLIIAPLGLLDPVWKHDIEKFMFAGRFTFPIYVMNETVDKARKILQHSDMGIYLINYEKVWRLEDELKKLNPDMIILDESSKIKTPSSKQSKAVLKLGLNTRYKSIMTGTVVSNSMMDIFAQYKFLNPNILGNSITAFRSCYFNATAMKFGGAVFNEYQISEKGKLQIKQLIDPISVSWKKDKCLDLPPLTVQDIKFNLSKSQNELYQTMKDYMVMQIGESTYIASMVLTKLLKLNMITSGFIQNTGGEDIEEIKDNAKLKAFIELVETIPEDSQVIIWGIFHHDIEMLMNELKRYGEKSAVAYYGRMNQKEKTIAYDTFKSGKARFLVAHPKSAGMGLNLSNANYAIFYSMNYSFETYAQSKERYNRPGQTKNMTEYRLIAKNTIDEAVFTAIEGKKEVNDYITSALS